MLTIQGDRPEVGACSEPGCQRIFTVHEARQRYCSVACQERAKKRRQRHRGD